MGHQAFGQNLMGKGKTKNGELARTLSESGAPCPVSSAHDKTNEAHYFLHEMMEHYHDCDRFRYSLSAFLQAARSVTLLLQAELTARDGFEAWYHPWREKMKQNKTLTILNSERVRVVHKETLIPASTMFFGRFEYGRWKSGLDGLPLDPMEDSTRALVRYRALDEKGIGKFHYLEPQRSCNCVEYGLTRKWSLDVLEGKELTDFCTEAFAAIVEVVGAAHAWCGAEFEQEVTCNQDSGKYRTLRESMIFPEVERAWAEGSMDRVYPTKETLPLRVYPFDESDILYTVTPKKFARGWISFKESPYWSNRYASMLIYSFAGRRLRFSNSVFFDHTQARVFREKSNRD